MADECHPHNQANHTHLEHSGIQPAVRHHHIRVRQAGFELTTNICVPQRDLCAHIGPRRKTVGGRKATCRQMDCPRWERMVHPTRTVVGPSLTRVGR
jgi:hypothetical protein